MKKRVVCFLLVAMMLVLFAVPAIACDHTDEDGNPLKYVSVGYVAPQIGVEGYSGDICCPVCGAVIYPGETLSALEAPYIPGNTTEQEDEEEKKPEKPAEPV